MHQLSLKRSAKERSKPRLTKVNSFAVLRCAAQLVVVGATVRDPIVVDLRARAYDRRKESKERLVSPGEDARASVSRSNNKLSMLLYVAFVPYDALFPVTT